MIMHVRRVACRKTPAPKHRPTASLFRRAAFTVATLAVLAVAFPAHAEEVCCRCHPAADASKTSCLTIDDTKLQNADNCATLPTDAKLPSGWGTCDAVKLDVAACKKIASGGGGVCTDDPTSAFAISASAVAKAPTSSAKPVAPIPFKLNVPIPGFTAPADMTNAFSAYLYAAFSYLISIAAIAATIMFIYGAFRYLVGSAAGGVARGREIMTDAVIGLLLLLSSTMILRTINPALTQLKTPDMTFIATKTYDVIGESDYAALTGGPVISKRDMFALAEAKARATGVPELPCIVRASMQFESGGSVNIVGHDENYNQTWYDVSSRKNFLKSGITYKGVAFTPVNCNQPSCQNAPPLNDDVFNPSAPPDYGLDWRFSHGFGAGQSTIFPNNPNNRPCEGKEEMGRGFRMGSKCFTIPELVSAEGSAAAMVEHFRIIFLKANKDIAQTFVFYAGVNITGGVNNKSIIDRVNAYKKCRGE